MLSEQWRSHWGCKGGQSATPDREKFAKNQEKSGKIGKKRKNREEKAKNWEGSFTLPLLTDRAGYATALDFSSLMKVREQNPQGRTSFHCPKIDTYDAHADPLPVHKIHYGWVLHLLNKSSHPFIQEARSMRMIQTKIQNGVKRRIGFNRGEELVLIGGKQL